MMRTILILGAVVASAAACDDIANANQNLPNNGYGVNGLGFWVDSQSKINLPLGRLTSACTSTTGASSTQTLSDGSSVSVIHRANGGDCEVTADWHGSFYDMNDIRAGVARDLPNGSADFDKVELHHFDLDIEHVSLRDLGNDSVLNIPDTAVAAYHAEVGISKESPMIVLDYDEAQFLANPNHPHKDVFEQGRSMDAITAALPGSGDVRGAGSLDMILHMDKLSGINDATEPVLQIDVDVDINGGQI